MGRLLEINGSLKELRLGHNTLGTAAAKAFSRGLSRTRPLRILDFVNNGMNNDVIMLPWFRAKYQCQIFVTEFQQFWPTRVADLGCMLERNTKPFRICIYSAITFAHVVLSILLLHQK
jgi:hypothetical protein